MEELRCKREVSKDFGEHVGKFKQALTLSNNHDSMWEKVGQK